MALLHTSPWKPSPYAFSLCKEKRDTVKHLLKQWLCIVFSVLFFTSQLLLTQKFVSIHPPSKVTKTMINMNISHSSLIYIISHWKQNQPGSKTKKTCLVLSGWTHLVPRVARIVSPFLRGILGSSVQGVLKNVWRPLVRGQQAPL